MQILATRQYAPPEKYEVLDVPKPEIKNPDEVLIKVHAASINPIDVKLAGGVARLALPVTFPFKLGLDLSGTVVAVGSSVPAEVLKPGDEVYSRVLNQHRGTAAEYAISTASTAALKPATLSHTKAASIPLASLTALQSLDIAQKHFPEGLKGKTVYIPGGLSGVGSAAVQLAKHVFGAKVVTTLSTAKIEKAGSLLGEGTLDRIVDYTKEDPARVISAGSVDFMFDTMAGSMGSLHLMKKGGLIVSVSGVPFGPDLKRKAPEISVLWRGLLNGIGAVIQLRAWRYGVRYHHLGMTESAEDLNRLREWIDQGLVKPIVGRVAQLKDLEGVRKGCAEVNSGKGGTGKFVIEVEH